MVFLILWISFYQVMYTANLRKEENKKQFCNSNNFQQYLSPCPHFLREKHLTLHKSLQTLSLTLRMCCHINARSKQTVHATSEDQGVKMPRKQSWLQKHVFFSGRLLLAGVTHDQGEKFNYNTELLLIVLRQEADRQIPAGKMHLPDTNE